MRLGCYFGMALLLLLLVACSEKNEDAPLYNQVHPESWNNTQYFKAEPFHGTEVESRGDETCAKCHDLNGKEDERIPGCSICHFGPGGSRVPPGSDWVHGQNRHDEFEKDQDVCNTCHDQGRYYGTGPISCHDCHEIEDHVTGQPWLDSTQAGYHGNQSQQECAACHELSIRCSQCHFGTTGSKAPTDSGWQHGLNDEHETFEGYIDTCNQCHALTKSYRNEPDPDICHDCHGSGRLHALGQPWLDSDQADYHGNQPLQDCATCHDLSADCNQCHFGATGSKSPPGSEWPHGQKDNHNDQKQYYQVCNECHSLTQAYRSEPDDPDCHVCHND